MAIRKNWFLKNAYGDNPQTGNFESEAAFDTFWGARKPNADGSGYRKFNAGEEANKEDIFDQAKLDSITRTQGKVAAGASKWAWGAVTNYGPAKYSPMLVTPQLYSQWNSKLAPSGNAMQWMTSGESDVQNKILQRDFDVTKTNMSTRQQNQSNQQTQANIEQSEVGATGRGSSTRRKEKRGGRASTLLAGKLGGSKANTASKALLGG